MTRLILATLFSATAARAACPNLAGRYVCSYQDRRGSGQSSLEHLNVTQTVTDGVVTYLYNESELRTDNQEHPLPDDVEMRQTTLRTWCDVNGRVRGRLHAQFFENNSYAGDLELLYTYAKIGATVRQITEGRLISSHGTFPLNSDVTCAPLGGNP